MRKSLLTASSLILTLVVMLFSAGVANAQADLEGKRISRISVQFVGAKTVDKQVILNNMSTKVGNRFDAVKLDEDIRTLVEKGLVDDIDVYADTKGGKVQITIKVDTQTAIAGVRFQGNTKFTDKSLLKSVDMLKPGKPLTDALILEARDKVLKKYRAFGFPDVVIRHQVVATRQKGFSDLVFFIVEGQKSIVRKIRFAGNRSIASHKLRNLMKTKQKGIFSFLTKSGNIDLDKLEDDVERILEHYRENGYLKVSSPGFDRLPVKDGRVDLVLNINEGAKYTVNRVAFGPMKVFKPAELAPSLTLGAGDAYSSKKIREDVKTIRAYYGSKGYADADVLVQERNAGANQVTIVYQVTEGRPYRIGNVNITGNSKTKDKVIRQEGGSVRPGAPLNSVAVEAYRKRLQNLDYFGRVIVDTTDSAQPGYRDVNIDVAEQKTGSVGFGLGFSSIDSVVGYVNLEQRNFDITNPWNFTGGGQRFGMNLRLGAERRDFKISLVEPWFMGRRLSLGGELYYKDALYFSEQYDQRNVGGAIFMRKPLGNKSYLRAEYRLEQVRVNVEDSVPAGSLFQSENGSFLRSTLSLNYVYDSRDALTTPRSGHKVDLGIYSSGNFLGGDVNTWGINASGSKHWNLWWDSIITLKGAVNVVDGDGQVPIFERNFLGGQRNLRGFEFRDVGPRDPLTGEVLGGNTSAFITAEWTVPVIENVRFATFFDAGFVNRDSFDFDTDNLHTNAGIGLRLNLPFGPIALDYAIPIDSPDNRADKGGQFNFYINYEF